MSQEGQNPDEEMSQEGQNPDDSHPSPSKTTLDIKADPEAESKLMTSQPFGNRSQRESQLRNPFWEPLFSTTQTESIWLKPWNKDANMAIPIGQGHSSVWTDWRQNVNPLASTLPEDDPRLPPFSDYVRGGGRGCCDITSANLPLREEKEDESLAKLDLMETSDSESEGPSGQGMAAAAASAPSVMLQDDEVFGGQSKLPQAILLRSNRSRESDSKVDQCEVGTSRGGLGFGSTFTMPDAMTITVPASLVGNPSKQSTLKRKVVLTSPQVDVDVVERKRRRRDRFGPSTDPASSTNEEKFGSLLRFGIVEKPNPVPIQPRSQMRGGNGPSRKGGKVPSTPRGPPPQPQPELPVRNERQGRRRPSNRLGQENWAENFDGGK